MGHRPYPNVLRARNQLRRRYHGFPANPVLVALADDARRGARQGDPLNVAMRALQDSLHGLTVVEALANATEAAADFRRCASAVWGQDGELTAGMQMPS